MISSPGSGADIEAAKADLSDHLPVWAEFRVDGEDDD